MPHGRLRFAWVSAPRGVAAAARRAPGTTANRKGVGTQASPRVILSDIGQWSARGTGTKVTHCRGNTTVRRCRGQISPQAPVRGADLLPCGCPRTLPTVPTRSISLPKRNYGHEKRQKELTRQRKKEEKLQRRLDRTNVRSESPDPVESTAPDLPPEE